MSMTRYAAVIASLVMACGGSGKATPTTYEAALGIWSSIEDINTWIGNQFVYDVDRAIQLSETRSRGRVVIYQPANVYRKPRGVCVDLARFGYETARRIAPGVSVKYLMVEFEPTTVRGNVLRRHWFVTFERNGKLYSFADSRRPGTIAGPYDSLDALVEDYQRVRQRTIVAATQRDSFRKQKKRRRSKHSRSESQPAAP